MRGVCVCVLCLCVIVCVCLFVVRGYMRNYIHMYVCMCVCVCVLCLYVCVCVSCVWPYMCVCLRTTTPAPINQHRYDDQHRLILMILHILKVTYQVRRLMSHPSIIVWGGNNENEYAIGNSVPGGPVRDTYVVDYNEYV